jgi:hypothetical protein
MVPEGGGVAGGKNGGWTKGVGEQIPMTNDPVTKIRA